MKDFEFEPDSSDSSETGSAGFQSRRENHLRSRALRNAIFNSANFSTIATDANGVIQIFNVGAERMLGYDGEEVVDRITLEDIFDPQEVAERAQALGRELGFSISTGFDALVFKASSGIEDIYELTCIRKDGSRLPAVVSVTALRDANESIIGYLLIGTDNTARKRMEQELLERNLDLQVAKVAAEKANLSKSEFLSSMSHELRSPLNAILGFAQLMESASPPPSPGQLESIGRILQAGWHLLNLINEILDLAKIESGKHSLSPEPVSLAEVFVECREMIEVMADKRDLRLEFPGHRARGVVHADRTRLKQILLNLLSNAVKYNRDRGVVGVAFHRTDSGTVRIEIRDTGAGLSPDEMTQLFQPFNRLGQESSGEEGTGIGLVVAKQLVEMMGGTIGAESVVGEGSVFWFELPAGTEPECPVVAREPAVAAPQRPGQPADLRRILYVEDNPANVSLVEQLVARRPELRLITAATGTLGLELARAHLPELILMDINLPDMSGFDALRLLREDPATSHVPVVAISANAMPHDIARGRSEGFFLYLTKPIKISEFNNALDAGLLDAARHRISTEVPCPAP